MPSSLIRQDLVPMVGGYVLIMGTLAIGLRLARRSGTAEAAADAQAAENPAPARPEPDRKTGRAGLRPIVRPGPGWRRLALHVLGNAVGGYLLLMAVIIGYYFGIAPIAGNFVESAFSGCAMLIGLTAPVWIALSWLTERTGWRL
jgi:Family of unknown function (DUF6256)